MLNKIILQGRLGSDVELRRTQSGKAVASVNLAVDRDFSSKDGGERETDWIPIVAWGGTGEFLARNFTKGRMAIVSGRLQIRNWKDKDGNTRRSAEVVADNVYFGDSKRENSGDGSYGGYQYGAGTASQPSNLAGSYGGYSAPAPNHGVYVAPTGPDDYATLDDADAHLPF